MTTNSTASSGRAAIPWCCMRCKRRIGTTSWFSRHVASCRGNVSAQMVLLMQSTLRSRAARLATAVAGNNALLNALIANRKERGA